MADLVRHPLIDEILDARVVFARGQNAAFEGYRNHAHRIQNFVRAIAPLSLEDEEKIAIAAAFHDLCAFDGLDYLEPSIDEAARYLRERVARPGIARSRSLSPSITASARIAEKPPSSWSRFAAPTGTTSR